LTPAVCFVKTPRMPCRSATRLLVLAQAVLLVPQLLLGSLCLREGEAAIETGICSCTWLPSSNPQSLGERTETGCGPCRDVSLTALSGFRAPDHLAQPSLATAQTVPDLPASDSRIDSDTPARSGDPPERRFSVLRC
jgi:hypothetical protein